MDKIAIIGTGLIGTSLGLALKQARVKDIRIVGTDIERRNASKAQKKGALDGVEGSLVGAVKDAEIIFIATPVQAMKDVMENIGPYLKEGMPGYRYGRYQGSRDRVGGAALAPECEFRGGRSHGGQGVLTGPMQPTVPFFRTALIV